MNDETQDVLIKKLLHSQNVIREDIKCLKDSVEEYKIANDKYKPYLDGALKAQTTREDMMKEGIKFVIQWSVVGILTAIVYALSNQK